MSIPETNGEKKGLMYVSAFWPIIAGVVVVTWSLASSISGVSSLGRESDGHRDDIRAMQKELATVRAENEVSKTERSDSKRQIEKLSDQFSIIRSGLDTEIATRGNSFTEVETQIDSMAQSLSIQFADSQRYHAGVSNALHELGAKFAEATPGPWFFPNISNRRTSK